MDFGEGPSPRRAVGLGLAFAITYASRLDWVFGDDRAGLDVYAIE